MGTRAKVLAGFGAAVIAATAVGLPARAATSAKVAAHASAIVAPLHHDGRWFEDATGRIVTLRGVNVVNKSAPFYPAAMGFGEDDAAFLERRGYNVVRVGIVWEGLEPQPGVIDDAYIAQIHATQQLLARHGIFTVLDIHQDGWGPGTWGNGAPQWATITDGLPNPPDPFPTYYITNPALQRAFENFWANKPAPDGVGIQDHYIAAAKQLARSFAGDPYVVGYDPMNEPWPGADWGTCSTGCPDIEATTLVPFYERFNDAIREVDTEHMMLPEPFVLFNFGHEPGTIPAIGAPQSGFNFHVYAFTDDEDALTIANAVEAATRTKTALLNTEWGAVTDPQKLRTWVAQFEPQSVPWIFWSYVSEMVRDARVAPNGTNVQWPVIDTLARPYAEAIAGRPITSGYEPFHQRFHTSWRARAAGADSVIVIPAGRYKAGYSVAVHGGAVVSAPNARQLVVRNTSAGGTVDVTIAPSR